MKWIAPDIQDFRMASKIVNPHSQTTSSEFSSNTGKTKVTNGTEVRGKNEHVKSESISDTARPRPRQGIQSYPITDDLILLPSTFSCSVSLNPSAKKIWDLCDGQHTVAEILHDLHERYAGTNGDLHYGLQTTLRKLQDLDLLEISQEDTKGRRPPVKFVVGIEDKTYFHWQLPILLESLRGQLPNGWECLLVVCNNHGPLSEPLSQIVLAYDLKYFSTTHHPLNHSIDFSSGEDCYLPMNRIQALSAVVDYVKPDDLVCLLETDIFLYKELNLDVIPTGNALSKNWIIGQDLFYTLHDDPKGVNLQTLLASLGCPTSFQPGGVTIFLTGETIKNQKFIRDCFRFTQIVYLMGKMLEVPKVWVAEMPCFALSLTLNGIPYDLLEHSEFTTKNVDHPTINPGSFYHYYHDLMDGGDGAFYKSKWYKQLFKKDNFLLTDISEFAANTHSDHEHYFFEMVKKAQRRLYVPNS